MQSALFAGEAGLAAPDAAQKDESPAVASGQGSMDQQRKERPDSQASDHLQQALQAIDGEACAREYLARVARGVSEPGELSALVSYVIDDAIAGALRTIEAALEARHG